MKIKQAKSDNEKNELDQLLWNILWKPLGLPHGIRKSFKLNNPQIDLIAVDNGTVIGGLVANWLSESENEIEIRHIAVSSDFQGLSVGKHLVEKMIKLVQKDSQAKIQTCARNTSVGFFTKLGFISTGEYLEHQDFALHGIKFQQMYLKVQSNDFR
jgi:N-acetylglutamate synthase-like GNAT family acetyltransferase